MSRSMEDIQKDYQVQTSIAGQVQYQIRTLQSDLAKMNRKLRELNQEAVALQQAEAKKKSESENEAGDSGVVDGKE